MKYNFDLYETQIKKNPGGEHSTTVNDNVNFFVNDQNIQQQSSQKIGFIIKQLTSRDYFDSKPSYDCLYTVSAYSYYFQRVLPTEGGK
ncbi:MAG: hypothetical protein MJ233_02820 [Mycoplasmoidaceae bacterium]|nr:hypothetical protein [Mycoplasmoidaceae bacterium]